VDELTCEAFAAAFDRIDEYDPTKVALPMRLRTGLRVPDADGHLLQSVGQSRSKAATLHPDL